MPAPFLALFVAAWLPWVSGCLPLAGREARLGTSSYGCMRRVLAEKLPVAANDAQTHCLAAGLIARYCSPSEGWLAVVGKEARDVVWPGDADVRDISAGREGLRCAKGRADDRTIEICCAQAAR